LRVRKMGRRRVRCRKVINPFFACARERAKLMLREKLRGELKP